MKGRVPGRGVRLSAPGGAQGWALSAETDGCLQKIVRAVGVAAFWDLGDGGLGGCVRMWRETERKLCAVIYQCV